MTWLVIALGWGRKGLSALWSVCTRYPWQCAVVALVALSVWCWRGWSGEQDGRAADRAAYVQAQADAKAAQDKANRANISAQTDRNKQVNHDIAIVETARADAVRDYIAGHRLRETACRPSSGASAAGLRPDPEGAADPAGSADMVAITPADLDALATEAVRGAQRYRFLEALVAEGLAVASD